jgi:hypothetical protein
MTEAPPGALDHLAVIAAGVAFFWLALSIRPLAALPRWLARK